MKKQRGLRQTRLYSSFKDKEKESKKKFFAKKSLGQNFLVDSKFVEKIIDALDPQADETIIEIGAGRGALTGQLIECAAKIIAIEIDPDLTAILATEFGQHSNFKLVAEDILKIDFDQLTEGDQQRSKTKIVANLPYYISTAVLQKLVHERARFSEAVLMLQREVAERITAAPGDSERGFLTILVEAYCHAEKLFDVPPEAFRPIPKVWSSVIKLQVEEKLIFSDSSTESLFWSLLSASFAQKRKTILNNLKSAPLFLQSKINEKGGAETLLDLAEIKNSQRAEALAFADWQKLFKALLD